MSCSYVIWTPAYISVSVLLSWLYLLSPLCVYKPPVLYDKRVLIWEVELLLLSLTYKPKWTQPHDTRQQLPRDSFWYRAAAEYSIHSMKHFKSPHSQQNTWILPLGFCPLFGQYMISANSKHQIDGIQWKAFLALPYYTVTAATVSTGDTEVLHESTTWLANICFLSINSYDIMHTVYISNSCLRSVVLQ